MAKEYELLTLRRYIDENYAPSCRYPNFIESRRYFKQHCYQVWAAKEFLSYVSSSKKDIQYAGEEFARNMGQLALKKNPNSWIFSVAEDVAKDLLDYIYIL